MWPRLGHRSWGLEGDAVEGTGQVVFRVPWPGLKQQLLLGKVTFSLCNSPLGVKFKEMEG